MAAQSVKIPVELQLNNIKGQIDELRKALGSVKEGTQAYKNLNSILQQLEKSFTTIQVESKKAFTSHGQIDHFSNGIEKLGNLALIFQERLSEVELKNLNIDLTSFNAAQKKFFDLREQLEQLQKYQIGEVFEGSQIEDFAKKLNIKFDAETTFDELEQGFQEAIKNITENEIPKLEEALLLISQKRKDFAKGLGKSVGTGQLAKDLEAIAKVNTTTSIKATNRDTVTTNLLTTLGLNLKNVKADGNSVAEYIQSVTASISTKIKEHNQKINADIVKLQKTKNDLEDALYLVNDLQKSGQKKLSEQDKKDIFYLTGISIDVDGIETAQKKLNAQLRKNAADTTSLQNDSISGMTDEAIQNAAKQAAQQLQIDAKLQAREFVKAVAQHLKSNGSELNIKDLEMQAGETEGDYILRIVEKVKAEGIELREELAKIRQDIQEANDLANKTQVISNTEISKERDIQTDTINRTAEDLDQAADAYKTEAEAAEQNAQKKRDVEESTNSLGHSVEEARNKIEGERQSFDHLTESARRLENIQDTIKRWFGFNEVINLTKNAIRDAISHIRELDEVMTQIAVVTDMTQAELWDQISTYSEMARQYGTTTQGVYEVSQLYYQQGLQTAEVMRLTEETLKMAKIANLDYADATDYMTVAIRGFKMEMSDAQNVVDVYSNIAAITASDTEELAVAMSKTASSAEAVGSSFENTTAMIALMVETTR